MMPMGQPMPYNQFGSGKRVNTRKRTKRKVEMVELIEQKKK